VTPAMVPARTPATPSTRQPHSAAPAASVLTAAPLARAYADLAWTRATCWLLSVTARSACWLVPRTDSSPAPRSRSTVAAANSPRRGASWRSARRAMTPASSGAPSAAATRLSARTRPAAGSSAAATATAAAPASAATAYGSRTRSHRSVSESTSVTSRLMRSPERNADTPAGASRSSLS